jgi:hypothetical protein
MGMLLPYELSLDLARSLMARSFGHILISTLVDICFADAIEKTCEAPRLKAGLAGSKIVISFWFQQPL